MDLKKLNTNVISDSFDFNGSVFELVKTLREKALADLSQLVDLQITTSETYSESPEFIEDEYDAMNTEGADLTESIEFYAETDPPEEAPKVAMKDIIDLEFTTKLGKFTTLLTYLNNIIKADGVVSESSTVVQDILNMFRTIDGIVSYYNEFQIATEFTQVGES